MALNGKYGVIDTSVGRFKEFITNGKDVDKLNGKIVYVSGNSDGIYKQGIYGLTERENNGVITSELSLFGTGAVADGSGYGLSQYNFDNNYKVKLDGIEANANNYSHPGIGNADSNKTLDASNGTYISGIKRDSSGHIVDISTSAISSMSVENAVNATNASTAEVANKLAKKLSINGIDFDGSKDVSLLVEGDGKTIDVSTKDSSVVIKAITGDVSNNSNALTTGAQVASYVSTQLGNLSGALLYKGTVANATELNGKTKTSGHVWISSAKGWEYTDVNGTKYAIEVGDMFICNGTGWNIVSSEFDVSTYNNELQWGIDVSIAVVDGVTIKAKLPANPNTDYQASKVGHYTPSDKDSSVDTTLEGSVQWKGVVVTGVTKDEKGHITGVTTSTIPDNPNTDTKVKDTSSISKSFLLGHATQNTTAEAQTNASCYMQGGKLFSNGKEVLTSATDTKCTSLSLSADSSVEDPSTSTSVNVLLNGAITASGSGASLSGSLSAVKVPTQKAIDDAKLAAIESATIYWETL